MTATTWTAPAVERSRTPHVAGERDMLESWLDFHRATLLTKCAGLTGDAAPGGQRSSRPG